MRGLGVVYVKGKDTRADFTRGWSLQDVHLVPMENSELIKALGITQDIDEDGYKVWKFYQSEFSHHFGGYTETANNSDARIISARIREDDPTILDVVYKVTSANSTVKVRVAAFEDGVRSFANVVRPETFVDGTAPVNWDAVEANVEHTLSWKVSSDWSSHLAKVKFEVMVCEDGLLPLELVTIPASEKYGAMKVVRNRISDYQVFDALLWLYAGRDAGLKVEDGCLKRSDGRILVEGVRLPQDSWWSDETEATVYSCPARDFVYSRMGFSVLGGTMLAYVNDESRLELEDWCYPGYKFVEE